MGKVKKSETVVGERERERGGERERVCVCVGGCLDRCFFSLLLLFLPFISFCISVCLSAFSFLDHFDSSLHFFTHSLIHSFLLHSFHLPMFLYLAHSSNFAFHKHQSGTSDEHISIVEALQSKNANIKGAVLVTTPQVDFTLCNLE